MTIPLLVGRLPSIHAVERAIAADRILFVTAQRHGEVADPSHDELFRIGTVVRVLQVFRLPDGTMRVLVEGLCRARVERFTGPATSYRVRVDAAARSARVRRRDRGAPAHGALAVRAVRAPQQRIPDEVLVSANNIAARSRSRIRSPSHLCSGGPEKQALLRSTRGRPSADAERTARERSRVS
jgi:ATP-dependent Lon protease